MDLPLLIEPKAFADKISLANNSPANKSSTNSPPASGSLTDKILIVDLSRAEVYAQVHVPGAVHLDFRTLVAGTPPATGMLPSAEQLSEIFSQLGLTEQTHVVAYDDEGGGWAGRLIWTLDMIGHTKYSYINGGLHAWLGDQCTAESTPNQATPSTYTAIISDHPSVDLDNVLAQLNNPQRVIWDARSPAEYHGERKVALKSGHIPGAVNYEWATGMDKNNHLKLRDLDEIRRELAALGIVAEKEIVTHCQTHHRSGFTYLLGKILGFPDIKAYPGSWSEWGNRQDTPVEA